MFRKLFPLIIILSALALFAGRKVLLAPLQPRSTGPENTTAAKPDEGATSEAGSVPKAAPKITTGEISRGASFFVEMQKAGLPPGEIDRLVKDTRETYNFRRIQPGQEYTLYETADKGLDSLHFVIDAESILKITRTSGGDTKYAARIDRIPFEVEHFVTTGTINSSIFNSLQTRGANPELASHLAIIFQWDIDFFKDIRKGDTYTILYEQKSYPNGTTQIGNVLAARIYTQKRQHYAFAYRSKDDAFNYYDANGKSLQKSLLRAPLRYSRISSNFSHRRLHPVTHTYKPHLGVDYVAPVGTPVRSTGNGTVLAATRNRGNGKYVKIRHNSRYTTYYLHLKGFAKGIRKGAKVRQGQVIGYLGATGMVTAAHLDYRIKVGDKFVNPRTIRLPSKEPVPTGETRLFEVTRDAFLVRFFDALTTEQTIMVESPRPPRIEQMALSL